MRLQMTRRLIDDQPLRSLNPLKCLPLGGHGWKIGWKIPFSYCSGHPSRVDGPLVAGATARVLVKVFRLYRAVVVTDECEAWWRRCSRSAPASEPSVTPPARLSRFITSSGM